MVLHCVQQNNGERTNVKDVVGLIKKMITYLPQATTTNPNPNQPCFHWKVYGHDTNHCFTLHLELWQGQP